MKGLLRIEPGYNKSFFRKCFGPGFICLLHRTILIWKESSNCIESVFFLQAMKLPTCFHCLKVAKTSSWMFVLQNSSLLLLIPPKNHRQIYREMFLGWCRPTCACFLFLSKSKGGSLAFYSCQSLLKSNDPASLREPGAQCSSLGGC